MSLTPLPVAALTLLREGGHPVQCQGYRCVRFVRHSSQGFTESVNACLQLYRRILEHRQAARMDAARSMEKELEELINNEGGSVDRPE